MELNFIGIGGAFNTELGSNAAYIKEDNKILFIDFGLDTFEKVVKHKLIDDVNEVYVLLTHLHGDHVGGLPTFIQYSYICFNKRVKLINNSESFTNEVQKLLKITAVQETNYGFVDINTLPFSFKVRLRLTTHTPLLECYSIIFVEEQGKTLYTSDSNDIEYLKQAIDDSTFTKIYTEVGETPSVHTDYKELKLLDKSKLVLMHIESMKLYEEVLKQGYKVPFYLK